MERYLQLSQDEQRLLCEQAQAKLGFPPATVEKDFWVCWTLRELFNLPVWGKELTFKGGTSLSKAWKLIRRFSEDIDIIISREFLGFSGAQSPEKTLSAKKTRERLTNLKETCGQRIREALLPLLRQSLANQLSGYSNWSLAMAPISEDADQQTILFHYPTALPNATAYIRPAVKIELGARSDHEPSQSAGICSYVQEIFPDLLGADTFAIQTLSPERTFLEKAMLLHEETYRPAGKKRRPRMARHYYDLWSLIKAGIGAKAAADDELFDFIVEHRKVFFKWSWMDYGTLKPSSIRLCPPATQIQAWRHDYQIMRPEMFYGEVPTFDEIMATVKEFEQTWRRQG
ncbi:MAG: nucleotidyl transferase AbiEii/AbiGii toxin family protein [Verrucomicrobiales bacterium]|nr:nucleotidyl transferase AbiEii/AbiGii toxin family protein [Verrucomicrobiales bacterium]